MSGHFGEHFGIFFCLRKCAFYRGQIIIEKRCFANRLNRSGQKICQHNLMGILIQLKDLIGNPFATGPPLSLTLCLPKQKKVTNS